MKSVATYPISYSWWLPSGRSRLYRSFNPDSRSPSPLQEERAMFNEASGRVPARVKRWLPHVAADREDLCADESST